MNVIMNVRKRQNKEKEWQLPPNRKKENKKT
jgi:hypothetical protein